MAVKGTNASRRLVRLVVLALVGASTACQWLLVTDRRHAHRPDSGITEHDADATNDASGLADVVGFDAGDAAIDVALDGDRDGATCAFTLCEAFEGDAGLAARWALHEQASTSLAIDPVGVPTNGLLAVASIDATEGPWISRDFPLPSPAKLALAVDLRVDDRGRAADLVRFQLLDGRYVNITLILGLLHLEVCDTNGCSNVKLELSASTEFARLTFELDLAGGVASASLPGQTPVTRPMAPSSATLATLLVGLPFIASGGGTVAARFDNLTFDVR